ncbi:MAG: L7Ae/L30e/S12e/Gadd45 family ribosomal protein [Bilifractor sp.]
MKRPDALPLLGLCMRAGKVASGETACEAAIRSGKAYLVLIASDASDNTVKKFNNLCRFREVPLLVYQKKALLGNAIGKGERSSLAVLDESFAAGIRRKIEEEREFEERSVL